MLHSLLMADDELIKQFIHHFYIIAIELLKGFTLLIAGYTCWVSIISCTKLLFEVEALFLYFYYSYKKKFWN